MKRHFSSILVFACLCICSMSHAAESLRVGGGPTVDVPQFILAQDKKMWTSRDLNVSVIPFNSGREAFEALVGGQLDLALMAEFPAAIGAMRGQPFGIVAALSRYNGNRLIVKDDKPVALSSLAGKPIGVTIGTNTHFMLDDATRKAGIKVETVNVAPPDIVPALARGDVAAGAPFPTFYPAARRILGGAYQEIPVSYSTTFVLVASNDLINKRPQALKAFLATLKTAQDEMVSKPGDAQQAVARAAGGNMNLEAVQGLWKDYSYSLTLDQALLDLLKAEGAWIKERGMIRNVEPNDELFRKVIIADPLKEVAPSAVTLR